MSKDIVVVGSCMIDFISYTQNLPKAGETVLGSRFTTGFGGKGANQCVAAAKLGGKTIFIARLGDDTWGRDYLFSLQKSYVDTTYIKLIPECTSGIAQITVDSSGQNQIVVVGGANEKLNKADVESAETIVRNASVLVCQLEIKTEPVIAALELCKGITILNGAPAIKNCDSKLFTLPSIFCVNETEASVFTGLPVNNIKEGELAIQELLRRGCKNVILTLGSQGVLQASKNNPEVVHVKSSTVIPVDTTGAGDAFIGALAYLIAEKPELELYRQMELACFMAAHSVTKPGTQISFADKRMLEHISIML